jgi:formylglycine-generating enzyme required for sulfatase activity
MSLGVLLAGACAQSTTLIAQSGTPAQPPSASAIDEGPVGLPPFLLMVPGGTVEVGLKSGMLFDAAQQVTNPSKPAIAMNVAAKKVKVAIDRSATTLGRRKVEVSTYFLARTPVTCRHYERYLEYRRKIGKPIRPPFGWWRFGRQDDYNERLPEINKMFPKAGNAAPLLYWEQKGPELPYKMVDAEGRSIEDHPVVDISYAEARQFAAWLGMRLPTENEWTRAARADGQYTWPWGLQGQADVFTEEALRELKLFNSRDRVLKPVGTADAGTGPYGHQDMFGQAWQIVSDDSSYVPINGRGPFEEEWRQLQKEFSRAWRRAHKGDDDEPVPMPLPFDEVRVIAKGGSYLSSGDPIQLLVDSRANLDPIEVAPSVGFRLAKSMRPGYDMLLSLLRGPHSTEKYDNDQGIELAGQIGAERYEVGEDGFPTAYHAVTVAPVDWLSKERDLNKLLESTQETPLLIGSIATTMPLGNPPVPAGLYSVLYRKEGVPSELREAVKRGYRDLEQAAKASNKNKEQDQEPKKGGWREVTSRFGIREEDVAKKEWKDGPLFVRVDGFEVPVDKDVFLLHNNDGDVVAAIPALNKKPGVANRAFASQFTFERNPQGKTVARITIGAPITEKDTKKVIEFLFEMPLDCTPPGPDTPWRLPNQ